MFGLVQVKIPRKKNMEGRHVIVERLHILRIYAPKDTVIDAAPYRVANELFRSRSTTVPECVERKPDQGAVFEYEGDRVIVNNLVTPPLTPHHELELEDNDTVN